MIKIITKQYYKVKMRIPEYIVENITLFAITYLRKQ
jgi:hypothetical protein